MTSRTIDVFDRVADRYDRVLPFFTAFARHTVAGLPLAPGERVLDLGAGHGAVTGAALERGCRVTAVDAAPAMVARVRARYAERAGLEQARVMDAHRLDLPDRRFDAVLAGFVIHLVADPPRVSAEVRRVLAPGGLVALTVPGAAPGDGDGGATDPLAELFTEYARHLPPGGGMGRPVLVGELLAEAGFTDVRARTVAVDLPPSDGRTLWRWVRTHGALAFVEDLPRRYREEFRARLVAATNQSGPVGLRRTAALWTGRRARD